MTSTKGNTHMKLNYFTSLNQIAEHIGDRIVFHGSCFVNQAKDELNGNQVTVAGREQRTFIGRFQMIDGQLFFAMPRRKKFFRLVETDIQGFSPFLQSLLVTKVDA